MGTQLDEAMLHAWAAGFIDGEGYIDAAPRSRNTDYYSPCVVVAQISKAPLQRLVDLYGGKIYNLPKRPRCRQCYRWQLASAEALRDALPMWIPFMTVKKKEAELLLELCMLVGKRGRHSQMLQDESIRDRRRQIAAEIRMVRK
jgi:hypothetical protein